MSKFDTHPYHSNYAVISAAFDVLNKESDRNHKVIFSHVPVNGNEKVYEDLAYEKQRIEEVRVLVNKLLEEYYKK